MKNDINEILKMPCHKAYSSRGADMGRPNQLIGKPEPLKLQRLKMVDGDYDTGGAYWGGVPSLPMWCAFSTKDSKNDPPIMVFVRGQDRKEAANNVARILFHWKDKLVFTSRK